MKVSGINFVSYKNTPSSERVKTQSFGWLNGSDTVKFTTKYTPTNDKISKKFNDEIVGLLETESFNVKNVKKIAEQYIPDVGVKLTDDPKFDENIMNSIDKYATAKFKMRKDGFEVSKITISIPRVDYNNGDSKLRAASITGSAFMKALQYDQTEELYYGLSKRFNTPEEAAQVTKMAEEAVKYMNEKLRADMISTHNDRIPLEESQRYNDMFIHPYAMSLTQISKYYGALEHQNKPVTLKKVNGFFNEKMGELMDNMSFTDRRTISHFYETDKLRADVLHAVAQIAKQNMEVAQAGAKAVKVYIRNDNFATTDLAAETYRLIEGLATSSQVF